MSELIRYDCTSGVEGGPEMDPFSHGDWVAWEDYEALQAKVEALEAERESQSDDYADLLKDFRASQAKVEKLGDELDNYEHNYNICDCCQCLTDSPVDADGHMQCPSCTEVANQQAKVEALTAAHKANIHQELRNGWRDRGHRCDWRIAYEAVVQRSKAALLTGGENEQEN